MKRKSSAKIRKLNIGGVPFKIKYYEELPKSIRTELGENVAGYCDWYHREIGLVTHGKDKLMDKMVLFHEIGHAVADSIKANNGLANENFAKPFFQFFFGALIEAGIISI